MKENEITQLINQHMDYVQKLAGRYRGKGVEHDDLVSEGYMAMVQAANKFDASRGSEFIAYAAPVIRKAMEKAIEQQQALYRIPKEERMKKPADAHKAKSIDAPLSAGNKYTLLDILINHDADDSDGNAVVKELVDELNACVDTLGEREQLVIRKFYGLGTPHITLAEIAEDMQIKRERARQIRNKALRHIARNSKSKVLKTFLKL